MLYGKKAGGGMAGLPAGLGTGKDLVLGHFQQNEQWFTGVAVANPNETTAAAVTLTGYDEAGTEVGESLLNVPARGKVARLIPSLFGESAEKGWIRVESDLDVMAFNVYGNKLTGGVAALPDLPSGETLVLSHFQVNDDWWTGIVVVNPGQSPATVQVDAYDPGGVWLDAASLPIPAGGKCTALLDGILDVAGKTGWIELDAGPGGAVAAMVAYGKRNAVPGELAALPAMAPSTSFQMSHFRSDADWWTGVALVNPGASAAAVTLKAWEEDGASIGQADRNVGPGEKISEFATGLFGFSGDKRGWIEISSTESLVGLEVLRASDETTPMRGLAGVAGQETGTTVLFSHYDSSSQWWTLFALANRAETPVSPVSWSAYDEGGLRVGAAETDLEAKGAVAEHVRSLFGVP